MKILVGVNTLTTIEQPAYSNHSQLYFRLGRNYPNIQFALNHPRRMSIDRMRNMTAKIALEHEFDYILFIDDDVLVPADFLKLMLDMNKDVVAAWTVIRGYPFHNMFFKWEDEEHTKLKHYDDIPEEVLKNGGHLPVGAVGFSCCLLKCETLKKVSPPYFVTGPLNTEDVYYCIKMQKQFPESSIYVNLNIKTIHMLEPEGVSPDNRDALKKYYETAYPELYISEKEESPDRGNLYLAAVKANYDSELGLRQQ